MSKPIVNGVVEIGSKGSEGTFIGITEFSRDFSYDFGEVRNDANPQYADLIEDQTSWTATLSVDIYGVEFDSGTDGVNDDARLGDTYSTLRTMAEDRDTVNLVLTFGGQSDFGDLQYEAYTEQAQGKITSFSEEGDFFASGEAWTAEIEVQGIEPFTEITP